MYIVYKIINKISNEYYIGVHKTKNINDNYYGSGLRIRRSIQKYGHDAFYKEILFSFDNAEEAFNKEVALLKEHLGNNNCLNLAEGGKGGPNFKGRKHTEETKRKLSALRKGKVGYKKSQEEMDEYKKNRYSKNNGYWCSQETKEKISKSKIGKQVSYDIKSNEERKHKISLAMKKRFSDLESRKKHSDAMKKYYGICGRFKA